MNLPKWLVQKLGKEKVQELAGEYTPTKHQVVSRPRNHACSTNTGKNAARKKWRNIRDGEVQPDTLYSLDDAIKKAGL